MASDMRCLKCDYELQGQHEHRCPECGTAYDPTNPATYGGLHRPWPRWVRRTLLVASFYPLSMLALVYLTYIVGAVSLGRLPRPMLDDPKGLGESVRLLMWITLLNFPVTWLAMGLNVLGCALDYAQAPRRRRRVGLRSLYHLAIAIGCWVVVILTLAVDPGRVLEWFLD